MVTQTFLQWYNYTTKPSLENSRSGVNKIKRTSPEMLIYRLSERRY